MRGKVVLIAALLTVLSGRVLIWGQAPNPNSAEELPSPTPAYPTEETYIPAGPSSWIAYLRDGCCTGPIGNHKPFASELYGQSGVSLPFGNTVFGRSLSVGFVVQGGARTLLYSPDLNRAWTIDASLSNINNAAGRDSIPVPITNLNNTQLVTVRRLNRTFVNIGLGRLWYLWGTADDPGRKWRVGVDSGGRYGTAKVDLNGLRHRTDVVGGAFAAGFSDLEFPFCSCVLHTGVRGEWSYTWSDILQQPSDLQEVNILVTLGVRF